MTDEKDDNTGRVSVSAGGGLGCALIILALGIVWNLPGIIAAFIAASRCANV